MALETRHTGTKADVLERLRQMQTGHEGAAKSMGTARKPDAGEQGKADGLAEAIGLLENVDIIPEPNGHREGWPQ